MARTCCPVTPSSTSPSRAPVPSGSTPYSAGRTNITRISPAPSNAAPAATAMRCLISVVPASTCVLTSCCREEIAGQLVADQQEATRHHQGVGRKRVTKEAVTRPPVCQADENGRQRQRLPDLHANVEADDVCDEAARGEREVLQLRGEAEAMEQAEDQHRQARIGLKAETAPEPVHVLERLVYHRETDDRVDEVWIGAHSSEHARQQRHAVPDGEQADVLNNVLQLVEEEDHAHEKEQVVVSGHHVF